MTVDICWIKSSIGCNSCQLGYLYRKWWENTVNGRVDKRCNTLDNLETPTGDWGEHAIQHNITRVAL